MEPNEVQLRRMFEALRQELALQWRARYTEILPGRELALSFEHSTNTSWRCLYIIRINGEWIRREFMSKLNYQLMTDAELTDRLEKGEMLSNPDLYVEFLRRMEEHGTKYRNMPEDTARWKADTLKSVHK